MAGGLLEPTRPLPRDESLAGYAHRIHQRDNERHYAAQQLEDVLSCEPEFNGEFRMALPSAGLDYSPHVLNLLEYLADVVMHKPECQIKKENGQMMPPYVTASNRWHCSRQGDWKRSIPE